MRGRGCPTPDARGRRITKGRRGVAAGPLSTVRMARQGAGIAAATPSRRGSRMPVKEPFPELDEVIVSIGVAGQRIAAIDASEGAAGNISVCLGWPVEVRRRFPIEERIELPVPAPSLAGRTVIVTGSGRRLRALATDPDASLGAVLVDDGGRTGTLFTSRRRLFDRVTSEWNSHLAVHEDVIGRTATNFQAIVHAQPPHLTYLSHVPAYQDQRYVDRRLLRWEPETLVALPAGIGMLAFAVPGSPELMAAN